MPYPIPEWLHGPPDPAHTLLSGYQIGADIALANARMQQQMRVTQMESQMKQQEFQQNQLIKEQQLAQDKAYNDAELGLKQAAADRLAEAAARKYDAIQAYQTSIQSGMDPIQAMLLHGPGMGTSTAEAAAIRASQQQNDPMVPFTDVIQQPDTGQDLYDQLLDAGMDPAGMTREDAMNALEPAQTISGYRNKSGSRMKFVPKSDIQGGPESDFAELQMTPTPSGGTIIQAKGSKTFHIDPAKALAGDWTPAMARGVLNDSSNWDTNNVSADDKALLIAKALKTLKTQPTSSPIKRALQGQQQARQLPKTKAELEAGIPYITTRGIAIWDGQQFVSQGTPQPVTQAAPQPAAPPDEE